MWAIALKYLEPVLSWVCLITLGVWVIWAGLIKPVVAPTPTTTQTGGISQTFNISPFSCARIPSPTEQVSNAVKPVTDKISSTVKAVVK